MSEINIVSLFCGAGGLDLGFKQAGYKIAIALDHCAQAIDTHSSNFSSTRSIQTDIEEIGAAGVVSLIKLTIQTGKQIGIIGGPPCQGFSSANVNSSATDPRNNLARIYMDIVGLLCEEYDVKFAVMENVTGIQAAKHKPTFSKLQSNLVSHGFNIFVSELNSANFGVPQSRKRVFLVGLSADENQHFDFPDSNARSRTVGDAIKGLPEPVLYYRGVTPDDIPFHPNHWTMRPISKRFKKQDFRNQSSRCFRIVDWDKPCKTIAFGNREIFVHPDGHRRLSIFEAMLLQGFPKYFHLKGTLSSQVAQVSNAVPPPVARALARRIKTYF